MSSRVTIPTSSPSLDHRQAADPVLDHQGGGLLQIHLGLARDQRAGGVAAGRLGQLQVVGGDADRDVAVGDHRRGTALRIADHD